MATNDQLDPAVRAKLDAMVRAGVIAADDLDSDALERLRGADVADALGALRQLADEAPRIRNKSAFLSSLVGKSSRRGGAARRDGGGSSSSKRRPKMDASVEARWQEMLRNLRIEADRFDDAAIQHLAALEPKSALDALDAFEKWCDRTKDAVWDDLPGGLWEAMETAAAAEARTQLRGMLRVEEFVSVHPLACLVPPQTALTLQNLWDDGYRLVAFLTPESWESLQMLAPDRAVPMLHHVAAQMKAHHVAGTSCDPNALLKWCIHRGTF